MPPSTLHYIIIRLTVYCCFSFQKLHTRSYAFAVSLLTSNAQSVGNEATAARNAKTMTGSSTPQPAKTSQPRDTENIGEGRRAKQRCDQRLTLRVWNCASVEGRPSLSVLFAESRGIVLRTVS